MLKQDNIFAASASLSRSFNLKCCCTFLKNISVFFSITAEKLGPGTAGFFHASETLGLQHRWRTMLFV